ncbi:hypothetical protein E6W39_18875 [Kitasatospora acidiphila]|uniref:Uncharacterized protein n=1 Tax=Kitasatospora acidiphila TaxID=2567942 RepID=A0A540W4G0_9ACTN|nr:hypothetical protein [Kitasatospora acidiphila]TQF03918.1 hypothetical protein E6W39_18875 [Kitasatospora acidiphila]
MSGNRSIVVKGLIRIATILVAGIVILFVIAAIKAPYGAQQHSQPAPAASCSTDSGSSDPSASQASWQHKTGSHKTTHHKTSKHHTTTHHKKTIKRA